MSDHEQRIRRLLAQIYSESASVFIGDRLLALLDRFEGRRLAHREARGPLDQRDAILITYADQVQGPAAPLGCLGDLCEGRLAGLISGVHLLPFYPWSSDDGFSVMDYRSVKPEYGGWEDIARLGRCFRLMFDAVINHASAQGQWFQGFLADEEPFRDYFFTVEGAPDLSQVVRPRALPLLTTFQTAVGERQVWTTFSADQVDLDYRNPDLLLEVIEILLLYVARGAELIRLDAVAFLWKEIGTSCLHLPRTHLVVKLLRAILQRAAPQVALITETNVPHQDNLSYFGDGTDEAQLVYNFALPPLTLHSFATGSARRLSAWARDLELPSDQVALFNFLASHDGIGLNPARGILTEAEIQGLVQQTLDHGGRVSYKDNPDGSQSPYELNINLFDALSDPGAAEPLATQVDRFMGAQAIMLALAGVPGIYFHSLFGSRGWPQGVELTGSNRAINRQKLKLADLERELADPGSLRHLVFTRYSRLLRARAGSLAFHPQGAQEVLQGGAAIFALLRTAADGGCRVLCLQNVSGQATQVGLAGLSLGGDLGHDLLTGHRPELNAGAIPLPAYGTLWAEVLTNAT